MVKDPTQGEGEARVVVEAEHRNVVREVELKFRSDDKGGEEGGEKEQAVQPITMAEARSGVVTNRASVVEVDGRRQRRSWVGHAGWSYDLTKTKEILRDDALDGGLVRRVRGMIRVVADMRVAGAKALHPLAGIGTAEAVP